MMFLIDKRGEYSYDGLLADVNERNHYFPYYVNADLYLYFVNFIVALVNHQPITLMDADLSAGEMEVVEPCRVNVSESIGRKKNRSLKELQTDLLHSKSEITLFTSGTTGQPKKVIHSIETLTRFVKCGQRYCGRVWAFAYNPTHMAGLQVFFQAVANANCMVNVFGHTRTAIFEAIDRYRITHISATPTFYRLLLPANTAFYSVERVTLGGEKSDAKLHEAIITLFPNARLNNIYASTEAGSLFVAKGAAFQVPFAVRDRVKVRDTELLIHKSLLGKSSGFSFEDDYYCTGDLIEWVDETAGIFTFKSRKNELVNVGGYKVNPSEVEAAILQIPGVLQASVYGKPNAVLGNLLCAEVRLSDDGLIAEKEIRGYLSSRLQDFKIPRIIRFVNDFELTRTGKMKRV